jgi:hypothetical protein
MAYYKILDGDGNAIYHEATGAGTTVSPYRSMGAYSTEILAAVDGLETLSTAANALLTTIDADTGNLAGILSGVDGLEALITTLNGYVDGLEGLLTTIDADTGNLAAILSGVDGLEALLTTLNGYVDGLETLSTAANALLTTIDADTGNLAGILSAVDGVEGLLTTIDADTSNLAAILTAASAIQTAVEILDNIVSGSEAQVDIVASLPAGTNNIGDVDVASIAAGDNNIGNVDIVTVPAPLSTTGGGTEATALRVTIASDSTGVVSVDDNGGSLTVDGTVTAQPIGALLEGGLTELIGINEQVDQNDYCGSVGVTLAGTYSGEILSIMLYSTEDGSGAVQTPEGYLYVFDADPSISSGDTSMTAAERVTVLGRAKVEATDWDTDANGGTAYVYDTPIPFHALATLYFVFKLTSATSLNDGAGDDEQLEFNFWYRRDS